MTAEPAVPLAELACDLPEPVGGWPVELGRRGVVIVADDLGRPAISRDEARVIYAEHREAEVRKAAKAAALERQQVEADRAFRAQLPRGIPAAVTEGVNAGLLMMLSDPERQGSRRRSVLADALEHPAGFVVYHPINEDAS
jgi:sensor c-di-GMP phosphodiesterase-like protein